MSLFLGRFFGISSVTCSQKSPLIIRLIYAIVSVKGGDNVPKWSSIFAVLLLAQSLFIQPISAQKLIPMGHTVEVQIFMEQYFVTEKQQLQSGEQIHVHDELQSINGQRVTKELVQKPVDRSVELTFTRATKTYNVTCNAEEWQQLQQKLSNETDGIGTLTYVTENKKEFGALGHQINLRNNGSFDSGYIHLANIQSVVKSKKNTPGYKIIHPTLLKQQVGNLEKNVTVGIFGSWREQKMKQEKAMTVAEDSQIKLGEAYILTQIVADKVERFKIDITAIEQGQLQFTVLDKELLASTGGVIQGMSGSPIIQNELFIGAVTHMFVESPKKGVAITMTEMLKKSN